MSGRSLVAFAVVLLACALPAQTVSFLAHRDFPIGTECCGVVAGDFHGDGKLDLVVPYGSGSLALLTGNGAGGLNPEIEERAFVGNAPNSSASHLGRSGVRAEWQLVLLSSTR